MYIQDWLTLKIVKCPDKNVRGLKTGDKVVYRRKDGEKYIGTYIGYKCNSDLSGEFLYKLDGVGLKRFFYLDKKAKQIFNSVKSELDLIFPMLKFITSKMNFSGNLLYLYFYGESRVDFRKWLNDLKELIGMRFFLYQVGARDRIRLHPKANEMIGDCGHKLCCVQTLCRIDSVETKTINLQNLQMQGIDKQKGLCGKLKCCLKYEEKIYLDEIDNYPIIGTEIEIEGKKYNVIGINTLSEYVFLKDQEGYIKKIFKEDLP